MPKTPVPGAPVTTRSGDATCALFMPQVVYGFSASDKFLLGATATLVAAVLRIPYSLGNATFGGRNWLVAAMVLLARPGLPLGRIWCAPR